MSFANIYVDGQTLVLHRRENVEVLWWAYGVFVLDADGVEIPELCFAIGEKPSVESLKKKNPSFIEGVTATTMHWVAGNHAHTLSGQLPLIHALAEAGQCVRVDRLLCETFASTSFSELLTLYGPHIEIVSASETGHVRVQSLLAFEPLWYPAHWGHEVIGRFFDHVRKAAKPLEPYRKLIITRPAERRGFCNLPDLVSALPEFEVVSLDGPMTLFDQVRLFAEAKIVISGHGAGLTNLVFMQPETAVVEIFNENYGTSAFWALAGMRHIRYCACIDSRGIGQYDENGKYEAIHLDVAQVVASVRLLQNSGNG